MICGYSFTFTFIALLTFVQGTIIHNLYQPTSFNENLTNRYRRQISKCETWSSWVDINHPLKIGDSDEEHFTEYDLESLCPANLGSITGFQCKDDRGEPRSNILNETSKDGLYSFSCYDYRIGVKCVVQKLDGKCPDFAINIFCNCTAGPRSLTTTETTETTTITITTRTTTTTTKRRSLKTPKLTSTSTIATTLPTFIGVSASTPLYRFQSFSSRVSTSRTLDPPRTTMSTAVVGSKSTGNERNRNTLDIGSLSIKWWQFLLILTVILFLVSLITSLCLFRRATTLLRASKEDSTLPSTQVHPLNLI